MARGTRPAKPAESDPPSIGVGAGSIDAHVVVSEGGITLSKEVVAAGAAIFAAGLIAGVAVGRVVG